MRAIEINEHSDHVSFAVRWVADQHSVAIYAQKLRTLKPRKFVAPQPRCGFGAGLWRRTATKRHTWANLQTACKRYGKPISPQRHPESKLRMRGGLCAMQFDLHSRTDLLNRFSERARAGLSMCSHRDSSMHNQQACPTIAVHVQARRAAEHQRRGALEGQARTADFERNVITVGNGRLRVLLMHGLFRSLRSKT
jgi:hypothetical protein